jgi:hypothetical protein
MVTDGISHCIMNTFQIRTWSPQLQMLLNDTIFVNRLHASISALTLAYGYPVAARGINCYALNQTKTTSRFYATIS